jgi:hypothetical protein
MGGEGLISVRFPRTLLESFHIALQRSGHDLHSGARLLVSHLDKLSDKELVSIPEPPHEQDNPRVSLYVGRRWIDALTEISHETHLPVSSVIRRIVYGILITKSLRFVQNSETKELFLVRVQNDAENNTAQAKEKNVSAAS